MIWQGLQVLLSCFLGMLLSAAFHLCLVVLFEANNSRLARFFDSLGIDLSHRVAAVVLLLSASVSFPYFVAYGMVYTKGNEIHSLLWVTCFVLYFVIIVVRLILSNLMKLMFRVHATSSTN